MTKESKHSKTSDTNFDFEKENDMETVIVISVIVSIIGGVALAFVYA